MGSTKTGAKKTTAKTKGESLVLWGHLDAHRNTFISILRLTRAVVVHREGLSFERAKRLHRR